MGVIARLFNFEAGKPAIADQVDEEFANVIAAIEGVSSAASGADVYQGGVLTAADWKFAGLAGVTNGATGSTTWPAVGGAAWLPGPAGALVRTFTPAVVPPATKPNLVLPGPGGFVPVGIELTPSGGSAVLSASSWIEQGSEAAALAAPSKTTAGKVRVFDYVLKNVGGVYSVGATVRDRRPWALGVYSALSGANLNQRFEFTGVPVEIMVAGPSLTSILKVVIKLDGATVYEVGESNATFLYSFTPAAGSHFIETIVKHAAEAATSALVIVRENVRQNANNGTA